MQAIETSYDGRRFRSRAEARWAVFLNALELPYQYEPEGVVLDGTPYLPDFFVPDIACWIEVKGQGPTEEERRKCRLLCEATGQRVLLAVGAPTVECHIFVFDPRHDWPEHARFTFREDRRNRGMYWLWSEEAGCFAVGPQFGPEDHDKQPVLHWSVERAFRLSQSARFEHGDQPEV